MEDDRFQTTIYEVRVGQCFEKLWERQIHTLQVPRVLPGKTWADLNMSSEGLWEIPKALKLSVWLHVFLETVKINRSLSDFKLSLHMSNHGLVSFCPLDTN